MRAFFKGKERTPWSVWPSSLTVESVLRCVRAGQRHAGTPRVEDGWRQSWERRWCRWTRSLLCALFSGTLLCLLLKLKPGTDNRANPPSPPHPPPARTCSLPEVNKQSRKIKARRRKYFCSLAQLHNFIRIVRHHYKTRPFICVLQKNPKNNPRYK